jgi:hypothetical protein
MRGSGQSAAHISHVSPTEVQGEGFLHLHFINEGPEAPGSKITAQSLTATEMTGSLCLKQHCPAATL